MPLTDAACRNAKARERPYKLSDSGGLYLLVQTNGSRLWRMNYRFEGRQKTLSFGPYPVTLLADARAKQLAAKRALQDGTDPAKGVAQTDTPAAAAGPTLKAVALDWHAARSPALTPAYAALVLRRLEADVFPDLGDEPIRDVTAPMLLTTLRKVEARGSLVVVRRLREYLGQIFRYAVASGLAERDPAADLRDALKTPARPKHHASLQAKDMPEFFLRLRAYEGEQVRTAIALVLHTFVRTTELREARQSEFDGLTWRIPAARMKMDRDHIVPLTTRSRAMVDRLLVLAGDSEWLLPGVRGKPISQNTLLYALYRMGYHSRITTHGFRGTASTILNESGLFEPDWIERQLAHVPGNAVRAAYNAAQHLADRRRMMEWWSDYLDAQEAVADLL